MKNFFLASLILLSPSLLAQAETDVYVMDIAVSNDTFNFAKVKNISNNEGYDNQPSFWDDNTVIYARNKSGQTDIATYDITKGATKWFNDKTIGGEYSPQRIPGDIKLAAVRLDPNGRQRLYKYSADGSNSMIFSELEVAYFAYHDKNRIIASILSSGSLELVVANVENGEVLSYIENTGRSIHKMPNSAPVSYTTVNEEKNHDIYLLDIDEDGESFFVCQLPIGVQDYAWVDESKIICGSGKKLYLYDLFGNGDWQEVADLTNYKLQEITRLAVSPNGKKLAFAAEPIAEAKVTEGYVEKAIKERETETLSVITANSEEKKEAKSGSLSAIKEKLSKKSNPKAGVQKVTEEVSETSVKETLPTKEDVAQVIPKKEVPLIVEEKKVIPTKETAITKTAPLPKKEETNTKVIDKVAPKKEEVAKVIPKNEVPVEVTRKGTETKKKEIEKVTSMPKKEEIEKKDIAQVTPKKTIPKNEVPVDITDKVVATKKKTIEKATDLPKQEKTVPKVTSPVEKETKKPVAKETIVEKKKEPAVKRVDRPVIENAEAIVQKHIAPYNTKKFEDMVACFSEDVVVRNFPDKISYTGRDSMLKNYTDFAAKNTGLWVLVDNRMSMKNVVIDEETALVSGKKYHQATVYEVNDKYITSMTFIHDNGDKKDPVAIVQKQLDAYNSRDIDAFMSTYSKDVELYNFPGQLRSKGQEAMKGGYAGFFQNTPDLHCKIENRIVVGNKVIDKELVTANGTTFSAIAIYEVENGLISKVTFIQ
ncbi:MAG: nuclear transport factor 2 family protein [Bacteroidota bacterium]